MIAISVKWHCRIDIWAYAFSVRLQKRMVVYMQVYVARQPIYDCEQRCFGYELLYRSQPKNEFTQGTDQNFATVAVLTEAISSFDWKDLTHGRFAFVNFTKDLLLDKLPLMISPDHFVIEILEDTEPDDPLCEMLELYREKGYVLAIDDYAQEASQDELMDHADIVKVDFKLITGQQRKEVAERLLLLGKMLLAEKVETEEDFQDAINYGYSLLQGYYFAKPQMLCRTAVEIGSDISFLMLRELRTEYPDFVKLETLVKRDVKLTYQVLRWVNSTEMYRGNEISSVRQALLRMGLEELRRRFSLLWMKGSLNNGNEELCKVAFIRGLVCEELIYKSTHSKTEANDGFLVGMFSLIDVVVSDTMSSVLAELAVSEQVKSALMGEKCPCFSALTAVRAYEIGDWQTVDEAMLELKLDGERLANYYPDAVKEAESLFVSGKA